MQSLSVLVWLTRAPLSVFRRRDDAKSHKSKRKGPQCTAAEAMASSQGEPAKLSFISLEAAGSGSHLPVLPDVHQHG